MGNNFPLIQMKTFYMMCTTRQQLTVREENGSKFTSYLLNFVIIFSLVLKNNQCHKRFSKVITSPKTLIVLIFYIHNNTCLLLRYSKEFNFYHTCNKHCGGVSVLHPISATTFFPFCTNKKNEFSINYFLNFSSFL